MDYFIGNLPLAGWQISAYKMQNIIFGRLSLSDMVLIHCQSRADANNWLSLSLDPNASHPWDAPETCDCSTYRNLHHLSLPCKRLWSLSRILLISFTSPYTLYNILPFFLPQTWMPVCSQESSVGPGQQWKLLGRWLCQDHAASCRSAN